MSQNVCAHVLLYCRFCGQLWAYRIVRFCMDARVCVRDKNCCIAAMRVCRSVVSCLANFSLLLLLDPVLGWSMSNF
jgi:hypothetical protein